MHKEKQVIITIPNDLMFAELVIENARQSARLMEFADKSIREIELGTEEAISNIIKNAFEEEQEETIDVIFNLKQTGLEIIMKEKGIPWDPEVVSEFTPEKFKESGSEEGLGMYLMKRFMDSFSFENLGKQGKETRLFKYLDQSKIENILSNEELQKAEEERKAEKLPKGSVKYTVRMLKPEEAVGVSVCAYASYGYTYVHEDIYYPDRVRALNKSGDLLSFVAIKDNGEVIAHAALEREDDPLVPEFGVAATKPRYRGQGCLNAISIYRKKKAKEFNFLGIYGKGITTHFFSQKSMLKHGMNPCALFLSSGMERKYKDIEQKKIQRESVFIHFQYMNPPEKISIFPPEKHAGFIEELFGKIGVKPEVAKVETDIKPLADEAKLSVKTYLSSMTSNIKIIEYGKNVVREVNAQLKKLCLERVESIYLFLPLCDKNTAVYCEAFEKIGFFFAGIKPASGFRDALVLQYLNNYEIDYDLIAVGCEFSERIKKYVRKSQQEVKQNQ